ETARGYIHDFHRGALKLVADRERGVLIGATLVTPRAGEIVGELVLAIKLGTPLTTLADVIHPFPAFNRVLGGSLDELAAKTARPGSGQTLHLVVSDNEAARAELIGRGADVSEAFHFTGFGGRRVPGPDPEGRSYSTFAAFHDPDGNGWLLQQITTRLPGRV